MKLENFTYLIIDLGSLSLPVLFGFTKKYRFNHLFPIIAISIAIPALIFIVWDILFTKMGIWGFTDKYLIGLSISNLPIEEILFFICIPFACLFTYYQVRQFLKPKQNYTKYITLFIILTLGTLSIIHFPKWYTSTTFLLIIPLLLYFEFIEKKVKILGHFYIAYAFILIPFFITNGILTGSLIPDQVVWYNDTENMGVRLITIPFEDTFYGMSLILMNVYIFEVLLRRRENKIASYNNA